MKSNLLRSARVARDKTQSDIAAMIEKSTDSYAKKERGEVYFTPAEMSAIVKGLDLSFDEFNDIFFDSNLQFGKI